MRTDISLRKNNFLCPYIVLRERHISHHTSPYYELFSDPEISGYSDDPEMWQVMLADTRLRYLNHLQHVMDETTASFPIQMTAYAKGKHFFHDDIQSPQAQERVMQDLFFLGFDTQDPEMLDVIHRDVADVMKKVCFISENCSDEDAEYIVNVTMSVGHGFRREINQRLWG